MKCEIKYCKQIARMKYYGKYICEKHWLMDCDEDIEFNLKKELEVKDENN